MTYQEIEEYLIPKLEKINCAISDEINADPEKPKAIKNWGRFNNLIISDLKLILCDTIKNPIMKYENAMEYYFPKNEKEACLNIDEKYNIIIKLQNLICSTTGVPFIYDKFTILKILQVTLNTYNSILNDCYNNNIGLDEDTRNLFMEIETMLINDRNTSAENNNANSKAIDMGNRYGKEYGGYGVKIEKNKAEGNIANVIISVEETNNKLDNRYNFTSIAEKKEKK